MEGVSAAAYIYMHYLLASKKNQKRKARRWWQIHLYTQRNADIHGSLVNELKFQAVSGHYKNFTRMTPSDFEYLLNKIGPTIEKHDTVLRKAISTQDRLAVTLRFLATGDSYSSLQYLFRISKQSISSIVPEVCQALVDVLKKNIKIPTTAIEWTEVSRQYERIWNFPHCLGALDGKHVVIQKPMLSGSEFMNYKSTFSIVLFAVVDADYNLLFVDAGCQGRISDGGVFKDSILYHKMEHKLLNFPQPTALQTRQKEIPFFFVGDDAFALCENVMKPFSGYFPRHSLQRIFNYRICRARRVVENVFGIMSAVFRVLRKPLLLEPEKAQLIVLTVAHLHNFLRRDRSSRQVYTPPGTFDQESENGTLIEGNWRQMANENATLFLPLRNTPCRSTQTAQEIRMELAEFFITEEGRVEWQNEYS